MDMVLIPPGRRRNLATFLAEMNPEEMYSGANSIVRLTELIEFQGIHFLNLKKNSCLFGSENTRSFTPPT